jgi:tRNA (guanine-N7-)-methyltransferase
MGKDKLRRFSELEGFHNVLQPTMEEVLNGYALRGKWNSEFFKNDNPIVLELGCGKGEYTVGLARKYKNYNFIGIDIKGARIWRGAKTCIEEGMANAAFVRSKVDFVDKLFGENEIAEIWLTFSDPQKERPRKRLTSPLFIARYKNILRPGGLINLKTDSTLLYDYTLEQIEEHQYTCLLKNDNVYGDLVVKNNDEDIQYKMSIKTFYEQKWLAQDIKIKYCQFQIN